MGTVSLVETFLDIRNLSTIFFYIILVRMIWMAFIHGDLTLVMVKIQNEYRSSLEDPVIDCHFFLFFSLLFGAFQACSWMILPFLPASNLFFPVGFVVAERVLYIPSMGFSMMVAYGWSKIASSPTRLLER